jgi:hypothetical protein
MCRRTPSVQSPVAASTNAPEQIDWYPWMPCRSSASRPRPMRRNLDAPLKPLLAVGKLGFPTDGMLTISAKTDPAGSAAPLLFAGTIPITQIIYQGHSLPDTFDMGATQTTLNPPFAKLFPDLIRSGKDQNHDMQGISGTTVQHSVSILSLTLQFGRKLELTPAIILLDQTSKASSWAAANFGYDLMQQARPFTLDFRRMKVEFPSHCLL